MTATTMALWAPLALSVSAAPDGDDASQGISQEELERVSREIEGEVAALREAEFLRPVRVEVADKAELMAYMLKRIEREYAPGQLESEGEAAQLLGLLPEGMNLLDELKGLIESQVGGYYDPDEDAFYLMSRFANTALTRTIIAHELTHALDDQLFGIDEILGAIDNNADRQAAFMAVVEGSGTTVMNQWAMESFQGGKISFSELSELGDFGMDELAKMPEYLWKPLLASYQCGQMFLGRTRSLMAASMNPATPADIDRAFRSPPVSTEQILHPRKYWEESERDEPTEVRLDLSALTGWEQRAENTLGELGLAMVCTPEDERDRIDSAQLASVMAIRYTNDAAEGWDGDRYALLARGEQRLLVAASVWDTPDDALEFHAALERVGLTARAPEDGATAVLFHAARGLESDEAARLAAAVRVSIGAEPPAAGD